VNSQITTLAIPYRSPRRLFRSGQAKVRHLPIKRTFDIAFSISAMFLGAPLFGLLALAVRLSSPGPVIYGHKRIGRGGRPFRCYKFRSMYPDAALRLRNILESDPKACAEWRAFRKLRRDPRITPIGRLLRKYSLDELPQFWNVLRGDLSIVGPRPLTRDEIVHEVGVRASKTLSVRPGLTCLWQVRGRNDLSYAERVDLDVQYVEKRSLWLDLSIICKTIPAMLKSRGAY
jgi:exopolysaccharide production protein ExoY